MALLSPYQNPRYTGANRCSKCTVLNLVLTVLATGLVATANLLAAAIVFIIGLLSIYFRGYLIPGTPTLTKRYLPSNVRRWFGHQPKATDGRGPAIESVLLESGALHEGDGDLYIDPAFQQAWRARVQELRGATDDSLLERIGGLEAEQLAQASVDSAGEKVIAAVGDVQIARWDSRGVFIADAAAAQELEARYDGWETFNFDERTAVLGGLRLWLEWCPYCDGRVALGQETVETCCDTVEVVVGTCEDCNRRLFDLRASTAKLAA
ncbi:hypothetical protein HTSR_0901 [Halodesulfurarchaeum formicicum]|uniref:Uncharacterized protein n=1 Tax=Halodesulfurarchaeum formicicum TaxID=1873524 RepID=A0A1D8S400_9EURY|nr:hypothetical protein [Halodesulfurarchaeum formicicum]AOW80086.1 hypothetical protein HTSR_0901 [Halodesulfurarchaeum formicicum]